MTTTTDRTVSTSAGARIGILVATVAIAVALNSVVAAIAVASGAPAGWAPLTAPVYGAFTIVPIVIGWFLWRLVSARVSRPSRTMPLLAAAVLVVSFVPDVVLLATGFIPGTTPAGVAGLMAMHVVVIGSALVGYTFASRR
jgi:hypothetical protein